MCLLLELFDLKKLYQWAPGPVAWWKFDELTGQTAYDSAASTTFSGGNHGTFGCDGGGCSNPTWSHSGKYGSAVRFDGTDDYILTDVASGISSGSSPRSITAWIYSHTAPGATELQSFAGYGQDATDQLFMLSLGYEQSKLFLWTRMGESLGKS